MIILTVCFTLGGFLAVICTQALLQYGWSWGVGVLGLAGLALAYWAAGKLYRG